MYMPVYPDGLFHTAVGGTIGFDGMINTTTYLQEITPLRMDTKINKVLQRHQPHPSYYYALMYAYIDCYSL